MRPDGPPLDGRPIMHQWWRDAVFVHWALDPARVAPLLPAGVRPDTHDGITHVGLVLFRMVGAGLGRGPAVPWLGTFLEANVRLYACDDAGRRGVVFRSLDADRLAVVAAANAGFGTPYRWARLSVAPHDPRPGDTVTWSVRRRPGRAGSTLAVRVGAPVMPGPLEVHLTARFGLHTRIAGRTCWVPNTHTAWPLHAARLDRLDDGLVAAAGLPGVVQQEPVSVLFSPGVRTEFGRPRRVRPVEPI